MYSTTASAHPYLHDEPRQKRQRPNPPFPEIERGLVLPSNRNSYGHSEEAGPSSARHYGDSYNQMSYSNRPQQAGTPTYPPSDRRSNSWMESPYHSPEHSRNNPYGQRSYQSPPEPQTTHAMQANVHLPGLANLPNTQPPMPTIPAERYWNGYDGGSQYPNPDDSRRSSNNSGSIPNILPPPNTYAARTAVENGGV